MKVSELAKLNKTFALQNSKNSLIFKGGKGNIPVVEIHNKQASAVISLQGTHLLSWRPDHKDDVIWLSEEAKFSTGKSVRGGIPVCWPWFGAHESNESYPAHGFARTVLWQVTKTQQISAGETQITFTLDTSQITDNASHKNIQQMWPYATVVKYCLTIGKSLTLELTTVNHSSQSVIVGQALHTYFKVDDVRHTTINGLQGKDYLDKVDKFKRKTQSGPICIHTEVDRVYLQTADDIIIDDNKRKIIIKKQGSHSTVVWNPWKAAAAKMGDLGPDGYLEMLCVESANAAEDTVTIKPGECHTLFVKYEVEQRSRDNHLGV